MMRTRRAPPVPEFRIDVHVHHDRRDLAQLFELVFNMRGEIMTALSDLQAEVTETGTVVDSAIALLQGLKAQLDEAIATGDPAALVALSAELDSKTNKLAAAVAANTTAPDPEPAGESSGVASRASRR